MHESFMLTEAMKLTGLTQGYESCLTEGELTFPFKVHASYFLGSVMRWPEGYSATSCSISIFRYSSTCGDRTNLESALHSQEHCK